METNMWIGCQNFLCENWSFRSDVVESSVPAEYVDASVYNRIPVSRSNVALWFSNVKTPKNLLLGPWIFFFSLRPLKIRILRRVETSESDYLLTLCQYPKQMEMPASVYLKGHQLPQNPRPGWNNSDLKTYRTKVEKMSSIETENARKCRNAITQGCAKIHLVQRRTTVRHGLWSTRNFLA
jgi:hypothetical protein